MPNCSAEQSGGISVAVPQLPGASASAPANRHQGNPNTIEPAMIMVDEPMHDAPNEAVPLTE